MINKTNIPTNMKQININGIGPVQFEHSKRAKHLRIIVKTSTNIRVAIPPRTSYKKAQEFVQAKKKWIQKHQNKLKELERNHQAIYIDEIQAKSHIKQRLNKLAKQHSLSYNAVSIRNQKTRWGSCSSKNNISLNIKLVMLPDELMDYVILHELIHTKVKNHSREFWSQLDGLVKYAKKKDSQLKQYRGLLFAGTDY